MQQRLMILGSMDEFVEMVKKAKARGIYTIVCDGYPDGPAKKFADKFYNVDIRKVDEIVEICKKEKLNGIIASFSDVLFEYLTKIADKAGLKTYCTPEKSVFLRAKSEMKKMFQELGIATPLSKKIHRGFQSEEIGEFSFPAVIKPIDGYGSKGIFIVNNIEEIYQKFDETAGCSMYPDDILIEKYNRGYEFNMMNWVMGGEVHVVSLGDREKSTEIKGNIEHVHRVAYPSCVIDDVIDDARKIIKKVADFTGIQTGPLSMQFFYTQEEGIEVCECAGRFFGYEHELVAYGSDLDLEELLLDYIYDEESMKKRIETHNPYYKKPVAGLYFHGYEGVIEDLSKVDAIIQRVNPLQSDVYYKKGERFSHENGAKPYLVRLYIQGDDREKLDAVTREIYENLQIMDAEGHNMVYHNEIPDYTRLRNASPK